MFYDAEKIKAQTLLDTLKERGTKACLKSALMMICFFFFSSYVLNIPVYIPSYIFAIGLLFLHEIFKPKIIIRLRELLNAKP